MLIVATNFCKRMDRVEERWRREGGLPAAPGTRVNGPLSYGHPQTLESLVLESPKKDFRLLAPGELGPACTGDPEDAGGMVLVDWDTAEILWESDWGNLIYEPAGLCFADELWYVADAMGANVFTVDLRRGGKPLKRLSHSYMNDIHSIERTKRGLLIASTGADCIIEIDLSGRLLYEWWAADHGYTTGPSGIRRRADSSVDHRTRFYHTRLQATHVNTAVATDGSERYILATLFHQGQLIKIDRWGNAGAPPMIVLDGLARPHGLEKTDEGWMLCNSAGAELVLLDQNLGVRERIILDAGWLQDCTKLSGGTVLLNDVDNHCLFELDVEHRAVAKRWNYDPLWRVDEVSEVPDRLEKELRRSFSHPQALSF